MSLQSTRSHTARFLLQVEAFHAQVHSHAPCGSRCKLGDCTAQSADSKGGGGERNIRVLVLIII